MSIPGTTLLIFCHGNIILFANSSAKERKDPKGNISGNYPKWG